LSEGDARARELEKLVALRMSNPFHNTAVVGIGRTEGPFTPDRTSLQLHAEVARKAIVDAGLRLADIDGVLTAGTDYPTYCEDVAHSAVFSEYLGLSPKFTFTIDIGTPVFAKAVEIAATAIFTGRCNTVLMACAEPTVSSASRSSAVEKMTAFGHPEFELPYGISLPAFYALIARRHMHEFGTTPEQLARVAVAMRRHAARNPWARFRDEISVDDVLASPMIADPLHRLDCSITTDGGGAFVMTSLERARDLPHVPIRVLGCGQGYSHEHLVAAPSFTEFATGDSGRAAYSTAEVGPADIDVALLYDNFTCAVILQLEALGFCDRGEGGPFVEAGHIDLGGSIPVNPNGGLLSEAHPGRPGGMLHLIEAIHQLRHTADARQVEGARVALLHNLGGVMSNHATAIFARD
jgi:acetyl-CoA acetyltransferase